jgi:hypothetical protein
MMWEWQGYSGWWFAAMSLGMLGSWALVAGGDRGGSAG